MKKILVMTLMLILSVSIKAQIVLKESDFSKSNKTEQFTDTTTNVVWELKNGDKVKVYKSKKGAYYYWHLNKNNKLIKSYLPKEAQIKLGRKYEK